MTATTTLGGPRLRQAIVLLIPREPEDLPGKIVDSLTKMFQVRVVYQKVSYAPLWISTEPPEAS